MDWSHFSDLLLVWTSEVWGYTWKFLKFIRKTYMNYLSRAKYGKKTYMKRVIQKTRQGNPCSSMHYPSGSQVVCRTHILPHGNYLGPKWLIETKRRKLNMLECKMIIRENRISIKGWTSFEKLYRALCER